MVEKLEKKMINFKLTIPGEPFVKKNTMKEIWFRWSTLPGGQRVKVPLDKPGRYYTKPYQEWAKKAVQHLAVFKHNNFNSKNPLVLPIRTPIFLTCIFFMKSKRKIDLSNLIEGIQDALAGDAGKFLGKKYDHSKYQILADDNKDIVKNLGATTIMFDPLCPRTEVFISDYHLGTWAQIMNLLHPNMQVANQMSDVPQLAFDLGSYISDDATHQVKEDKKDFDIGAYLGEQ